MEILARLGGGVSDKFTDIPDFSDKPVGGV